MGEHVGTFVAAMAGVVIGATGMWFVTSGGDEPVAEPTIGTLPMVTVVETIPPPPSTATSTSAPTTGPATVPPTAPPATPALVTVPPTTSVPYRSQAEQVAWITGDQRAVITRDLAANGDIVSVDKLSFEPGDPNASVEFQIGSSDAPLLVGSPKMDRISVGVSSIYVGPDARGAVAWYVIRYLSPLWSTGQPIRDTVSLEVFVDDQRYDVPYPLMARVADQTISSAELLAAVAELTPG